MIYFNYCFIIVCYILLDWTLVFFWQALIQNC
jgi:hypothetical protein